MQLFGRKQLFTDVAKIDENNIVEVLNKVLSDHQQNSSQIEYLLNYAKGKQPILGRAKEIRKDINEKIVDNMAAEILSFKLGYEFGTPVTYVQRARKGVNNAGEKLPNEDDFGISALNEMMVEESKSAKDIELARFIKTCGVGYRLIYPKKNIVNASVFDYLVLNPMTAFVVYSNDAFKRPMLAVSYAVHEDGSVLFGCYTDGLYCKIKTSGWAMPDGEIIDKEINMLKMIPIIEYINDYDRMGCFERVIPLMDGLNTVNSDRVNDIAQNVQNLLWGDNVTFDEAQKESLHTNGIVLTQSPQGQQAILKYLESKMNQSENQTVVDYMKQQILDITSTPSRSELSGGSTGAATNMSSGWMVAETDAKAKAEIFASAARQETLVILRILEKSTDVEPSLAEIKISDLDIRFSRSRTYDLATKCNSLATLINVGVDPLKSIEVVGLFTDPQQVAIDSQERIDEKFFTSKTQGDEPPVVQVDTQKVSASDE